MSVPERRTRGSRPGRDERGASFGSRRPAERRSRTARIARSSAGQCSSTVSSSSLEARSRCPRGDVRAGRASARAPDDEREEMARALVVVVEVLGVIPNSLRSSSSSATYCTTSEKATVRVTRPARISRSCPRARRRAARARPQRGRRRERRCRTEEHARRQRGLGRDAVGVALRPHRGAIPDRGRVEEGDTAAVARGGAVAGRESHEQQVAFEHGPYPHDKSSTTRSRSSAAS